MKFMKSSTLGLGCCLAIILHSSVTAASDRVNNCLFSAAQYHKVDHRLLKAIAITESDLNPNAKGRNQDGTTDHGMMQINDWWLPQLAKFGITREQLSDPCVSAYVGAWILAHEIKRHGYTWRAVGAYNSPSEKHRKVYVGKVSRRLADIQSARR